MSQKLILGIDPGVKNLGCALYSKDSEKVLRTGHHNFKGKTALEVVSSLEAFLDSDAQEVGTLVIERYVAYKGVTGQAAEDILLIIGALIYWANTKGWKVYAVRAIEWKSFLVKYCSKNGFSNPSSDLDKKFSMALAAWVAGDIKIKTDHEADAACLSYLGSLL